MKTNAQVGYETHAATFGIDIEQPIGGRGQATVKGAIPWESLPPGEKTRWQLTAEAITKNERERNLKEATDTIRDIRAKQPTVPEVVTKDNPPTETFVCSTCGASMMKGENHDCKAVVAHRRALGHKLPGDIKQIDMPATAKEVDRARRELGRR